MDKSLEKLVDETRKNIEYLEEMGIEYLPFNPGKKAPSAPLTLEDVRGELGQCTRCRLWSGRTNIVFGVGNPNADLMFIGEAPGRDDDIQGEPFVGRAGQLLTDIIRAMGLSREDVYIANIIKCRPPGNRNPARDESETCQPFLLKQIAAIGPRVICTLGNVPAQTILNSKQGITKIRGRFHDYHGIKVMPTFHPAYLLRNPGEKTKVWEDMKQVMAELGLNPAGK
jgi:DNA polymerase